MPHTEVRLADKLIRNELFQDALVQWDIVLDLVCLASATIHSQEKYCQLVLKSPYLRMRSGQTVCFKTLQGRCRGQSSKDCRPSVLRPTGWRECRKPV